MFEKAAFKTLYKSFAFTRTPEIVISNVSVIVDCGGEVGEVMSAKHVPLDREKLG